MSSVQSIVFQDQGSKERFHAKSPERSGERWGLHLLPRIIRMGIVEQAFSSDRG